MADERVKGALDFISEGVQKLFAQAAEQQKLANALAAAAGLPPEYDDIAAASPDARAAVTRADQFADHAAPSSAARAYLEVRGRAQGAATIDQIYEALTKGGYSFGTTNVADAKNGLRIALGKDVLVARLANGYYGLREWYPHMVARKEKAKKSGEPENGADDSSEEEAPTSARAADATE